MSDTDDVPEAAVEFIGMVNALLHHVDVPDGLRHHVETARGKLTTLLAAEDAGIHRGIWSRLGRGFFLDAAGSLRGPDGSLQDPHA